MEASQGAIEEVGNPANLDRVDLHCHCDVGKESRVDEASSRHKQMEHRYTADIDRRICLQQRWVADLPGPSRAPLSVTRLQEQLRGKA